MDRNFGATTYPTIVPTFPPPETPSSQATPPRTLVMVSIILDRVKISPDYISRAKGTATGSCSGRFPSCGTPPVRQEPTETSKQYLGHVTGYQPIDGQSLPIRSVPAVRHESVVLESQILVTAIYHYHRYIITYDITNMGFYSFMQDSTTKLWYLLVKLMNGYGSHVALLICWLRVLPLVVAQGDFLRVGLQSAPVRQEPTETSKQYLGHMTGYQPINGQSLPIRTVPAVRHESVVLESQILVTAIYHYHRYIITYDITNMGFYSFMQDSTTSYFSL
eukprot:sb/3468003/